MDQEKSIVACDGYCKKHLIEKLILYGGYGMKTRSVKTVIILLIMFCLNSVPAYSAGTYTEPGLYASDALTECWAAPVKCHILSNNDGTISLFYVIETDNKVQLCMKKCSITGNVMSTKKVTLPGIIWGGSIYRSRDGYFYVITGNNYFYSPTVGNEDVCYVTKLNENLAKIGSASITTKEANALDCFYGGNCDMDMIDKMAYATDDNVGYIKNILVCHFAKRRPDYHQSSATIFVDTKIMKILGYRVGDVSGSGYTEEFDNTGADGVSHSMNQFVLYDNGSILFLDQGDGNPRGIVIQKNNIPLNDLLSIKQIFTTKGIKFSTDPCLLLCEDDFLFLLKMWGAAGENYTGTTVNAFEKTKNGYIVVGTSIPHDQFKSTEEYNTYANDELDDDDMVSNNIFISSVNNTASSSKFKWFTHYKDGTHIDYLNVVKINNNKFILMYSVEDTKKNHTTNYMIIDGDASIISKGSIEKEYLCNSEVSIVGDVLVWGHYVNSALGTFLSLNTWDYKKGTFHSYPIKTNITSNISSVKLNKRSESGEYSTLELSVYSSIFDGDEDNFTDAYGLVNWKVSDPSIIQLIDEETPMEPGVWNYKYKTIQNRYKPLKKGCATVTAYIGDKRTSIDITIEEGTSYNPDKSYIVSLVSKIKKSVSVKWKLAKNYVTGYELQYSSYKDFSKNKKSIYINNKNRNSRSVNGLVSNKYYYFRIRTYYKVSNKKYYSKWSASKKMKVK